jgi:hypothetical protein
MSNGSNGNGVQQRLLWWIVTAILGPLILGGAVTTLNQTINNAQRISTIEAHYQDIQRQLDNLDAKLDRIIDRGGK